MAYFLLYHLVHAINFKKDQYLFHLWSLYCIASELLSKKNTLMQPVQSVKQTLFCSGSPHSQQHINNIIYSPDLESQTAVLMNLKFELDGQSISKKCLVPLRKLSAVPLFRMSCCNTCLFSERQ